MVTGTIEDDPDTALSGLLAMIFLFEIVLCAVFIWSAVSDGSIWGIAAGLLIPGYLGWSTWRAGRIVRRGLHGSRRAG